MSGLIDHQNAPHLGMAHLLTPLSATMTYQEGQPAFSGTVPACNAPPQQTSSHCHNQFIKYQLVFRQRDPAAMANGIRQTVRTHRIQNARLLQPPLQPPIHPVISYFVRPLFRFGLGKDKVEAFVEATQEVFCILR